MRAAKAEVEWLIALTRGIRAARRPNSVSRRAPSSNAFLENASATARSVIEGNVPAIDRLARLSAIHYRAAPGRRGDAGRRRRGQLRLPARRRDRHRRREGPPRQGARGLAEGSQVARRAARQSQLSSSGPSPKRSRKRAPTMPITPPRPSGWRRRWHGWVRKVFSYKAAHVPWPRTMAIGRTSGARRSNQESVTHGDAALLRELSWAYTARRVGDRVSPLSPFQQSDPCR